MSDKKVIIACSTEYKDYSFNEKLDIWTLISVIAPILEAKEEDEKRAPIDIVAVIDKSGSMAGEKLSLVKKTLEFVVSQLNEKDRLCLVTYDTKVYLDFKLTEMTKDNKNWILTIIKNISDGSSTNLCGGLMKGLCQIICRDPNKKNEVASVLLFTDGLANEGITHSKGIIAAMKDPKTFDGPTSEPLNSSQLQEPHHTWLKNIFGSSKKEEKLRATESTFANNEPKTADASVYTFGFGSDHNAQMLKDISDAGNGMYYYIENADKISEAFGHCLGGLLSTVAQGIQLEVTMGNKVLIKEVHTNRPIDKQEHSVKINMGDLQSEESRDVVLELSIDSLDSPTDCQTLFNVKLNYFNVINDCLESSNAVLTVLRPIKSENHDVANSNAEVNKQRSRVNLSKAMKVAYEKAENGDLEYASRVLNEEMASLKTYSAAVNNPKDEMYYIGLIDDTAKFQTNVSSKSQWNAKGKNANLNIVQQHECQRSSNLESVSYLTAAKCSKRVSAKKFVSK
ncbi:uncharacterized protein LOC136085889 isoform X2 [Hydra vulgaris]|uniref:Uncharacterized protein LOC136085889 isoform X2 n=1 Tax=Hydra vulgaris TaxID=6087 RepID=A0ABM4CPK1_HYDVU